MNRVTLALLLTILTTLSSSALSAVNDTPQKHFEVRDSKDVVDFGLAGKRIAYFAAPDATSADLWNSASPSLPDSARKIEREIVPAERVQAA